MFAPSGKLLARCNSRDIPKVIEVLDQGLAAWQSLPEAARHLAEDVVLDPEHRWEDSRPRDGLVLDRIGRELGPDGLDAEPQPIWNRDFAWFSAGEVRLDAPLPIGKTIEMPLIARRLARYHLVDNVRGQTIPFAEGEVKAAELRARVIGQEGALLRLELEGHTLAEADGPWNLGENLWKPRKRFAHGIECRMLGTATYDVDARAYQAFELVAVARRWGRTQMNGRGRDASPGAVAFHLGLAGDDAPAVAPTFIAIYDAPWVVKPAVGTWLESPAECGLEAR